MMEFAQPLIDSAGEGIEGLNTAMSIAMICWNLALCQDEREREDLLVSLSEKLPEAETRIEFRTIATQMVERHRQMFPEMHRAR